MKRAETVKTRDEETGNALSRRFTPRGPFVFDNRAGSNGAEKGTERNIIADADGSMCVCMYV